MNKRCIFLFLTLFILLFILLNQNITKYVYVSPQVNTSVLPYINKSIKPIEFNLKRVMKSCQKEKNDMRYAYINYYGSGFLKENQFPNDLDVSVGVDLGTYEYDGTNINKIAQDIENKISSFHTYLNVIFISDKKTRFVVNTSEFEEFTNLQMKKSSSIENLVEGLSQVMENKVQVLHFNKKFQENDVDYTFFLNKNEVLFNDINPFFSYTKGLKYNKQMNDFPREMTILPNFYVTIKNSKTKEVKNIEIFEESFMGERFQLSRRFFVPIVFTGNNSLNYIKNLDFLNDDKKYIETRMFNYFRYINELELYFELSVDNIKLIKRLHQCADIIEPVLSQEEKEKIYSDISSVFENNDIRLANDYITAIKNLNVLVSTPYIFKQAIEYNYIKNILDISNLALEELSKNKNYKEEINNLKKYQFKYLSMLSTLSNEKKLEELNNYLNDNVIDISVNITKIINSNIENRMKFLEDYEILKDIATKAGFHKIEIYQFDLENIYILKDDFTKNFTSADLKKLAKENNLQDINYKLVDENTLNRGSRSEIKYIRYNSTQAENEYWQELQNKLLEDKKNFSDINNIIMEIYK